MKNFEIIKNNIIDKNRIMKYLKLVENDIIDKNLLLNILLTNNFKISKNLLKHIDNKYKNKYIDLLLNLLLMNNKYLDIININIYSTNSQIFNKIDLCCVFGLLHLLKENISNVNLSDINLKNLARYGHSDCIEFIIDKYPNYYIGENMFEGVANGVGDIKTFTPLKI